MAVDTIGLCRRDLRPPLNITPMLRPWISLTLERVWPHGGPSLYVWPKSGPSLYVWPKSGPSLYGWPQHGRYVCSCTRMVTLLGDVRRHVEATTVVGLLCIELQLLYLALQMSQPLSLLKTRLLDHHDMLAMAWSLIETQ